MKKTATATIDLSGLSQMRFTGEPDHEYVFLINFNNCSKELNSCEIKAGYTEIDAQRTITYLKSALKTAGISDNQKIVVILEPEDNSRIKFIRSINSDIWVELSSKPQILNNLKL